MQCADEALSSALKNLYPELPMHFLIYFGRFHPMFYLYMMKLHVNASSITE